eukprot:365313-Chlamydomonas_euryale.AAC.18
MSKKGEEDWYVLAAKVARSCLAPKTSTVPGRAFAIRTTKQVQLNVSSEIPDSVHQPGIARCTHRDKAATDNRATRNRQIPRSRVAPPVKVILTRPEALLTCVYFEWTNARVAEAHLLGAQTNKLEV